MAGYCGTVCFPSKDWETIAYLLNGLKGGGIFKGLTRSLLNLLGWCNNLNTFKPGILVHCDSAIDPVKDLVAQPSEQN